MLAIRAGAVVNQMLKSAQTLSGTIAGQVFPVDGSIRHSFSISTTSLSTFRAGRATNS